MISHIINRDSFQLNFAQSEEKNDKSAVMQISQLFRTL